MDDFTSITHEPRVHYLPVIFSGRLGRAPFKFFNVMPTDIGYGLLRLYAIASLLSNRSM